MAIQEAKGEKPIVAFNAGEWGPKLYGRFDLEKYGFACQQLENFTLLPQGAAVRRAGTQYIADVADSTKKSRLIGFNFSTEISYILELSDLKVRFYKDGAQLMSGGSPFEVVSPWVESELFEVQFVQLNDVMFHAHANTAPQKLIRLSDTSWTLAETIFKTPALLEENLTTITLTPSVVTGSGTLTASSAVFESGHVGSSWQLKHIRDAAETTRSLTATGTSAEITVRGETNFVTTGRWDGTVQVQAQDPVTLAFETIREFTSVDASLNIDTVIPEEELSVDTVLRINYTNGVTPSAGPSPATAHLTASSSLVSGIVKITAFTSTTLVNITVTTDLNAAAATTNWSEGAWSDVRGFPRAVGFFEQRIIYGGTRHQPQTIWGSVSGDFQDLELGTLDDDGFNYTFASPEQNAIQWINGSRRMLIGTTGGEWSVGATSNEESLTPTNVRVVKHASYGSKYLQAPTINDVVLFVQRIGLRVRELVEDDLASSIKYKAPDLTILADHITSGKILQTAYSQQPDSIFWTVTGDGVIAGMTYEREQDVVGWHRQTTDGEFESIATIYGDDGDEVWVTTKRTINGATKRFVERLNPVIWENEKTEALKKEKMYFVDAGITVTNPLLTSGPLVSGDDYRIIDPAGMDISNVSNITTPTKFKIFTATASAVPTSYGTGSLRRVQRVFSGLTHLIGKTVQILGDGNVIPDQVVSATGTVTVPEPEDRSSVAQIGLEFVSKLQPMNLDIDNNAGAHPGSKKQIRQIAIRVLDTIGGTYTTNLFEADNKTLREFKIPYRDTADLMDESPPLQSGYKVENIEQDFALEPDITLIQRQPLPMKITLLNLKHNVTGTS